MVLRQSKENFIHTDQAIKALTLTRTPNWKELESLELKAQDTVSAIHNAVSFANALSDSTDNTTEAAQQGADLSASKGNDSATVEADGRRAAITEVRSALTQKVQSMANAMNDASALSTQAAIAHATAANAEWQNSSSNDCILSLLAKNWPGKQILTQALDQAAQSLALQLHGDSSPPPHRARATSA